MSFAMLAGLQGNAAASNKPLPDLSQPNPDRLTPLPNINGKAQYKNTGSSRSFGASPAPYGVPGRYTPAPKPAQSPGLSSIKEDDESGGSGTASTSTQDVSVIPPVLTWT